ncbi:MAG: preprotein translocase subunit SecG [Chthonomonas sp.]|nr:preprotein translocase subunit SecG [Chthonomonas sp.]
MNPTGLYNAVLGLALVLSVAFIALIYFTGKGDAMSGSGSIRTTFKGKASVEDQISRLTYIMAFVFVSLMVVLDVLATKAFK